MHDLSLSGVRSVLCLGAHGDDIEIGAGATLAAMCAAAPGLRVHWVILSATAERAAEVRASAADLLADAGSSDIQILDVPDGTFPAHLGAIKAAFEALKALPAPDLIFTHARDDRHQDHRVVSDMTWNTFRDHLVFEYEVPKYDGDLGQPNVFVPVEDRDRQRKVDTLLTHYRSQRTRHWFTKETFEALLRLRGIECRSPTGYAEAFHARKLVLTPGRRR